MKLVRVGRVVRAIGLTGHVGVGGSEGALARVGRVTLRRSGEPERTRAIAEARRQGKLWVVRLEGVASREEAEALVGWEVLADRQDLGEAGEGLHYWVDLEGLPVVTSRGEAIGRVTGLMETGAVDVLVVTGERGEVLVPLAPYVQVDEAAGKIVVDPPDGLLEMETKDREGKGGPERGG